MASKYFRQKRPGPKPKSIQGPFNKEVHDQILHFLGQEFTTAATNTETRNKEHNDYYKMIHCMRQKKNDWESDIYLPEYVSRLLTQIGNFVSQYFSSRDFVEPDIESEDPWDIAEAKAAKRLLNALLNDKKAHYFPKLIRLLMFVFPTGYGVIKGGYKQAVEIREAGVRSEFEPVTDGNNNYIAEDGMPYTNSQRQRPMMRERQIPVYETVVKEDRPIFDVYPNQYVHTSPEYQYSLQDKEYVIFETRKTLDELEDMAEQEGYFNIHMLQEVEGDTQDFEGKGVSKRKRYDAPPKRPTEPFVILERYGKYPVTFDTDAKGEPINEKPGVNKDGEVKKDAELKDCIITYVKKPGAGNDLFYIIGFKIRRTSMRPMVRFLCYVDSHEDNGFGDGEASSELQTASNDMYNISNFRTLLATTPAFKGKKFSGLPHKVQISPEAVVQTENIDDLQELMIRDDMAGAMTHLQTLSSRLDYAMATSPQTMGMEPDRRETATMGAIIDRRASIRIGMKSMNLEFIGFVEFYDMLLSLCNDYMLPQTLEKHMGDFAPYYNPEREDRFKPVSQALETEESKNFKVKMWDQVLGRIVGIQNPKTPMAVNYILGQILELMGGDFKHFKRFMLSEDPRAIINYMLATGNTQMVGQTPNLAGGPAPTQNQMGLPQGTTETGVREMTRNEMAI